MAAHTSRACCAEHGGEAFGLLTGTLGCSGWPRAGPGSIRCHLRTAMQSIYYCYCQACVHVATGHVGCAPRPDDIQRLYSPNHCQPLSVRNGLERWRPDLAEVHCRVRLLIHLAHHGAAGRRQRHDMAPRHTITSYPNIKIKDACTQPTRGRWAVGLHDGRAACACAACLRAASAHDAVV